MCQKGSRESGHYYSFVLVQGRWFLCDDTQVMQVSKDRVLTAKQDSYMLFYKVRINKAKYNA